VLRHGIFMPPFHQLQSNPTLAFERDLRLIEWLDELGFHEAWVGEHHSAGQEIIACPELFIAAAAERTKHIRFGTGVVSLPNHHPLMVANRLIQLDHMTRGRVMFGVGPGLLASDHHMMGISPESSRGRMAQSLDAILRLLRGEVVTEKTDWYELRDARVHLLPYTQPFPEVSVASAVTPSGGRLAGKYDLGMLCVAASDQTGFNALDTNWAVANEVAAEHGRVMDRNRLRIVVKLHLADTAEQAREDVRFGMAQHLAYLDNNMPRYKLAEDEDAAGWAVKNEFAVIGTPQDAIERIERVLAKVGDVGAVLLMAINVADVAATRRSYELYANHVIPHFSGVNATRQASYDWVTTLQDDFSEQRVRAADQMFAQHAAERAERGLDATQRPDADPLSIAVL
jgi:limonene 1,2-monooxygenase